MNSLFATISGEFGKALILGAFLPSTVFVILWIILVSPLFPPGSSPFEPLQVLSTEWEIVAISFLTIVLTGLLHSFNIPIIRLYQGYSWKDSVLGRWRLRRYQDQFHAAEARIRGIYTLRKHPLSAMFRTHWSKMGQELRFHFPERVNLVLPTRLGNVIRSFERYPEIEYGMEAVDLWPRLGAVIEKNYAASIEDARTSFNFMLHTALLMAVLAFAIALVGFLFPSDNLLGRVVVPASGLGLFSYGLYLLSIRQAESWGTLVRGAFDLYRKPLLELLGYEQTPKTRLAERELWRDISKQMIWGDKPVSLTENKPRRDYAAQSGPPPSPTEVRAQPDSKMLRLTRSVRRTRSRDRIRVVISISNAGTQAVQDIVVKDTSPGDYLFEWNSALVRRCNISVDYVEGIDPYYFHLRGSLQPHDQIELTYHFIRITNRAH